MSRFILLQSFKQICVVGPGLLFVGENELISIKSLLRLSISLMFCVACKVTWSQLTDCHDYRNLSFQISLISIFLSAPDKNKIISIKETFYKLTNLFGKL